MIAAHPVDYAVGALALGVPLALLLAPVNRVWWLRTTRRANRWLDRRVNPR